MISNSILLFTIITTILFASSSSSLVLSSLLTTQEARVKFCSLLAEEYSFTGTFYVFNQHELANDDDSKANFTYECNISVANAYDISAASLSENVTITSCINQTGGIVNEFDQQVFDKQLYRDSSSSDNFFIVSSINKYFDLIYQNENNQLLQEKGYTLRPTPDAARGGEYYDSYQVGIPALLEWNLTVSPAYQTALASSITTTPTTFVRFHILTLLNISKTDPLRVQQSILWSQENESWYEDSPVHMDVASDFYHFDLITYLGNKNQPNEDDDPAGYNLYLNTFEAYRVGVNKKINAVYRLIDVKTNRHITNVTREMVERGLLLTIEEHLSRIQLAIDISTSIGVFSGYNDNGSISTPSATETEQDRKNINLFYAEYDYVTGAPMVYSWKNPFYSFMGYSDQPNEIEPYNTLRTWRISNIQSGRLNKPPYQIAAGVIVMIIIGVVLLVCGIFYKMYQKVSENEQLRKQAKEGTGMTNGPPRNPAVSGNNMDLSRMRRNQQQQNHNTATAATARADDFNDLESHNTSAFEGNNNRNNNGSYSPRNDAIENNTTNTTTKVSGEVIDAELASFHAIETIRKKRQHQQEQQQKFEEEMKDVNNSNNKKYQQGDDMSNSKEPLPM